MDIKKIVSLPVNAMALLIVGLAGCGEKPAGMGGFPMEVDVFTVKPEPVVITALLPGRLTPYRMAQIRPRINGIILKQSFKEGSRVKTGQLLYQIDAAPYAAAYESAQAALLKAKANYASSKIKAKRYQELADINAISKQDYEDMLTLLATNEADVKASEAQVKNARINLDYTKITSPIAGQIGKSFFTEGALITAQQADSLATVSQIDPMYVDISQSSAEILHLRHTLTGKEWQSNMKKAKVTLLTEDGSEYPLHGTLEFSDISVDPTTGAILLRATFPNPNSELLPGMFVRARVETATSNEAILAPQIGVTHDKEGEATVLVVDAENKVAKKKIVTQQTVGDKWVVTSGLQPGEQIIISGLQKIQVGMVVKPVLANNNPENSSAQISMEKAH